MRHSPNLPDSEVRLQNDREWIARGIKALRKRLGLTQSEMAQRAGISERSVRRYENKEVDPGGVNFMMILRLRPDAETLRAFGIKA
jgi:transcriptional regulator with XRE-family HTH domain